MIYVALLRGINVGGNAIVSMAKLKDCFTKLGFANVKTYINSGNVIFESTEKNHRALEEKIENSLQHTFSFPIRVLVRSYDEIKFIIQKIPKDWKSKNDWRRNVIFVSHRIDNIESLKDLSPKADIEELIILPGVLLWSAKTADLTKSNMLKLNKSHLYKEMTVRGLNTVHKIYELMEAMH